MLRLDVDEDVMRVTQVLQPGFRAYVIVFMSVFYLVGLGGLIGSLTGGLLTLALVAFPAYARLFVIPLVRRRQRDAIETYFADHLAAFELS